MTADEQREQAVQNITEMLQTNPFTFEFKVKKRPQGIRVIYEVTQEEMDALVNKEVENYKQRRDKK